MTNSTKKFDTFEAALDFRRNCPYCQTLLMWETTGDSYRYQGFHQNDKKEYIVAENTQGVNIIANLTTLKFENMEDINEFDPFGTYYCGLKFKCDNCKEYYFMLQIVLDIGREIVRDIILNSENIRWYLGDKYYAVNISYPFNTVKLNISRAGQYYNRIELPLMALDVTNKEEVLETLKTYATFI